MRETRCNAALWQDALTRRNHVANSPLWVAAATETVQKYWDVYCKKRESLRFAGQESSDLVQFRWMIEELRVSLFAQKLGTSVPVSEKRLDKLLASIEL